MKNKTIQIMTVIMLAGMLAMQSCKKEDDERTPPSIKFVTGAGYVSSDLTLSTDTSVVVGITVTKTEDELRTFNVSRAYDNAPGTTTVSNETISGNEVNGFARNVTVHTRVTPGLEKYIFTTTDKDGNVASVSFILTVQ